MRKGLEGHCKGLVRKFHITFYSKKCPVNFRTPSTSRDRLKLGTSNLAHRLATGGPNEKSKIRSKKVVKGSRDLLLEFWDPSISRERLKLET